LEGAEVEPHNVKADLFMTARSITLKGLAATALGFVISFGFVASAVTAAIINVTAAHLARVEELNRELDFQFVQGQHRVPMAATCLDVSAAASLIQSARQEAGPAPFQSRSPIFRDTGLNGLIHSWFGTYVDFPEWKMLCQHDFGPLTAKMPPAQPEKWCFALLGNYDDPSPSILLDITMGLPIYERGDDCTESGQPLAALNPDRRYRNASRIVNVRLTTEFDDHAHLVSTFWISTIKQSWGAHLADEYARVLYSALTALLMLTSIFLALVFLTIHRIVVVSKQRDPNSLIPWAIEMALRGAALDHEPDFLLAHLLDKCEDADRGLMKWALLCGVLIDGLPTLLSRRACYFCQRPFVLIWKGTERAWRGVRQKF
jgi:hypothetical protein